MEGNVRVADRIFSIIELLAYSQSPMPLSLIAQSLELSKSTVHRLLQSMLDRGYVVKTLNGHYTVGSKLIEVASYYINSLELHTEAGPFLSMLYSQINLSVHLGILEDYKLVYISKLDLYPTTKCFAKIGYQTPAYCSSIGKCLLAALSGKELEQFIDQCDFTRFTATTITDPEALKSHLRHVRLQGWAIDNEESQLDHRCIAVPIFDYRGTVIASVGISGTPDQISDEKIPILLHELQNTALQISRRMGYVV